MPKTTKREATRRAERIARAHNTQAPPAVKPVQRSNVPKQQAPKSSIFTRYPWAITLTILVIAVGIYALYANHVGPFAIAKTPAKKAAVSACLDPKMLKQLTNVNPAPSKGEIDKITHSYKDAPAMTINTNKIYCAGLNTNRGLIVVELDPKLAPKTVNNFVFLAQNHFYDGEVFHRVIQSGGSEKGPFIIQAGNPSGTSTGPDSPGYSFADEPVQGTYTAGTIAMANKGPNTNGSQFFISTQDNSNGLDKKYNLFGKVVKGLDIAQSIQGPNENDSKTAPDLLNYVVVAES